MKAHGMGAALLASAMMLMLAGCDMPWSDNRERIETAREFPMPDRPVAAAESTNWTSEEARDRVKEAEMVMDGADVRAGMTVADIGAGDGYYTVRLAMRVGATGRVLAQDIMPEAIDRLADRVARERLDNVSLKLGAEDDPRLPADSFDRIFMVHMYHEIAEPYAFLWRLHESLREGGEVIVVDANRPVAQHGMPLRLLLCEFEAVGYKLKGFTDKQQAGGYMARFVLDGPRPESSELKTCKSA